LIASSVEIKTILKKNYFLAKKIVIGGRVFSVKIYNTHTKINKGANRRKR
jgi:hypothetical protein